MNLPPIPDYSPSAASRKRALPGSWSVLTGWEKGTQRGGEQWEQDKLGPWRTPGQGPPAQGSVRSGCVWRGWGPGWMQSLYLEFSLSRRV